MEQQETRLRAWICHGLQRLGLGAAAVALLGLTAPQMAMAQTGAAIVVQSDRGGMLGQRRQQIRQLRASGQRVELRGTCLSACTMYLSLPNVCVAATASFGFHGPSRNQRALPPVEFEHWSEVMARNYREPLRSWFLSEARYRITGYYALSGAELIRMGYAAC